MSLSYVSVLDFPDDMMDSFIHSENFDDTLEYIDDARVEETQEEGESFAREVFNDLYWKGRLTPIAYEKEHERIYGKDKDIVYEDNLLDDIIA